MLYPPYNFGVVDDGIFRSGFSTSINISFLQTLNLNTIIYLGENLDDKVNEFIKDNNIKLVVLPSSSGSISEETVVEALSIIVNNQNSPVLISCQTGKNLTGEQNLSYVICFCDYSD